MRSKSLVFPQATNRNQPLTRHDWLSLTVLRQSIDHIVLMAPLLQSCRRASDKLPYYSGRDTLAAIPSGRRSSYSFPASLIAVLEDVMLRKERDLDKLHQAIRNAVGSRDMHHLNALESRPFNVKTPFIMTSAVSLLAGFCPTLASSCRLLHEAHERRSAC